MPYVAGQLVDQLLARVRDTHALGTSRVTCRLLLTHLQRIVNARDGYVVDTLSFPTVPYQQIYKVSDPAQAPAALRMLGVQEGARDLKKVLWKEFWYFDRAWGRAIGPQFELWSMIGRDLLVLWPSKPAADTVTLVYAKLTAMVVQHWLLLVSCWAYPDRSLVKAAQTVRAYVPMLASAMAGYLDIALPIEQLKCCLFAGCRMNPRRKKPNAYQLLLDLQEAA